MRIAMGKIFNKIYILLLVVFITGCASNAPKFSEVKVSFPTVDPGNGRIYLYRPSKLMGFGYTPKIFINDIDIGKLESGGFFFIDRPEGEYHIDSRDGNTKSSDPENHIKFSLAKGETKYIKFTFTKAGFAIFLVSVQIPVIHPEIVAKEKALVDLSEISYIDSPVK
jgi:hypothetical protein